jgi:iron complex outermembrane receptor protein
MAAMIVSGSRRALDARAPNARAPRRFIPLLGPFSALGAVGSLLLSSSAFAQDPAPEPAEPEPAPAEAPPAEAAPAAAEPGAAEAGAEGSAEAAAGDDASLEVGDMEVGDVDMGTGPAEGNLDEVVVTVDRRRKDLQDYSGVAASFSESKLASVGITNAREMAAMVPGLQIGVQEGNTEVYIRGVGSDNNTELGDPAVALHVDGVYIPRPRGIGSMFFDIERVEVNSGPQGTLRGRNAMGGAVNIVSARPKLSEFGANAEATFGTFAQRRYQGMVNVPIGDMLAFRFAGFSEVHDSYWVNAGPVYDITPAENANAYALRAQVLFQPAPAFSVLVGYDLTKERGTGYLGANFQGPLTAVDTSGAINGPNGMPSSPTNQVTIPFDVNDVDNPRRVYYRGMQPDTDLTHQGVRGEITFDAGPVILQALASYRDLKYTQVTGANAGAVTEGYGFGDVSPDVFTNGFWDSRSQSLIGELRAFAPDDARLRWTAGGFFFDEDQQVFLGQVSDPVFGFGGGEFNMPDVKGGSFAGYLDATFDVTESFRVLGGIRATYEDKSRKGGLWALDQGFPSDLRYGTEGFKFEGLNRTQYDLPRDATGAPIDTVENRINFFLNGIDSFGARDTLPIAFCNDPPTAAPGEEQQPRVQPGPGGVGMVCTAGVRSGLSRTIFNTVPQNNEVSNKFFDWRAGIEYDITKDSLVYFTTTTGHKAGGFNDTAPGVMQDTLYNSEYGPESVLAFELGSKNTFLDRALRVNASAFMYRYDDMVFQTIVGVDAGGDAGGDVENMNQGAPSSAVRQNAATTTPIYGLDLDLTYRLPAGLEAEVHVLLMDAKFSDDTITTYTYPSNTPEQNWKVDLGGNWLPRVSPYTINYTLSQLIFTSVGSFDWVIQAQTRGKHYMSVYNGEGRMELAAEGEMPANPGLYNALLMNEGAQQRFTDVVPTYTRFDIGAGWKHPDGRISINGFINNVSNLAYSTSIITTPTLNLRFYNPPRTAGVRFRVDW